MSLLRHHNLLTGQYSRITHYGSAGPFLGDSVALEPPPNMRSGDLVYVYSTVGSGSLRSLTKPNTGGQTWFTTKVRDGDVSGIPSIWISWCQFNGTWSANPVFAISGSTVAKGHVMHVFRAPKLNPTWAVDQGPTISGTGASSSKVITGQTNTQPKNVTIGSIESGADSVTGNVAGAGWYRAGDPDYQITGANARMLSFAYQVQGYRRIPVGPTGNATITTLTGISGIDSIYSFYFT